MMVYFFIGVTESQSAVLLPQLKEKGSTIHVTPDEETWIGSFVLNVITLGGNGSQYLVFSIEYSKSTM